VIGDALFMFIGYPKGDEMRQWVRGIEVDSTEDVLGNQADSTNDAR